MENRCAFTIKRLKKYITPFLGKIPLIFLSIKCFHNFFSSSLSLGFLDVLVCWELTTVAWLCMSLSPQLYLFVISFFLSSDERFSCTDLIKTNFMCPFVCEWQHDKCETIYQKKKVIYRTMHTKTRGKKSNSKWINNF